ncbi:hypothetical protein Sala_3217 (plasmid) [Sphingopyxis alaskensis RB2256]|uniref:Phage integrase central domain-containing protein n=1 Tax=Sphingopyxis alaskensis (strain DSM 13593 / LMG 18877 / RB2256) TaxID=317655 RepID=Q1J403_SPHAL|nr:hypothetical protein Sala_3217 [Sphingopyxis alaskensis RB2256]
MLAERKSEAAAKMTFRDAARQYHGENAAGWKSAIQARQWLAGLESHAFLKLGDLPTGRISAADMIDVLLPIWQEIPKRRVRSVTGSASASIMRTQKVGAPAKRGRAMAV